MTKIYGKETRLMVLDEVDEWFTLDEHNDMNVYTDMDGNMKVVVYPVVEGQTKTEVWKQIWPIHEWGYNPQPNLGRRIDGEHE